MITEREFDEAIILITLLMRQSFTEALKENGMGDAEIDSIMEAVGVKLADAVNKEEAERRAKE